MHTEQACPSAAAWQAVTPALRGPVSGRTPGSPAGLGVWAPDAVHGEVTGIHWVYYHAIIRPVQLCDSCTGDAVNISLSILLCSNC